MEELMEVIEAELMEAELEEPMAEPPVRVKGPK